MKKRIISLFLAVTACFTFLASCTVGDKNSSNENSTDDPNKQHSQTYGNKHEFTMTETENYLVENGRTDYVLVLPENADVYEKTARDEFITFFKQATDIKMKVVQENEVGLTHSKNVKYISLGQTKLLESADLEVDYEELGSQGVRIITKDNSIYMIGGGSQGVLYAVYDFMQLMFNYEIYYHDYWVIDENVRNVKLYDFDVTDVPDIEMRVGGWGPVENNVNNVGYRFRSPKKYEGYYLPVGDVEHGAERVALHNSLDILPVSGGRWEWFSKEQQQICYTAHGDAEAYEQMVERIAYVIEQSLIYYTPDLFPDYNTVAITNEDVNDFCYCNSCMAAKEKYGQNTGATIVLCNRVMEKVSAWMELPENATYKRDLTLVFFAYSLTTAPPTHFDKDKGEYVANHPDCEMRDDVGVFYAVNVGMDSAFNYQHENSDLGREQASGWFSLTDNVYLWTYSTNFATYMAMMDTYNLFDSDLYRYYVQGGAKYMFDQGSLGGEDVTAFQALKMFLDYKLMWNCSLDSGKLMDEFFTAMYKEGAPIMRELFEQERTHNRAIWIKYIKNKLDMITTYAYLDNTDYWSSTLLKGWMSKCTDAIAVVEEKYKTADPVLYEKIKYHIELEYCSPVYYLLNLYPEQIGAEEKTQIIAYTDEILHKVGNIYIGEVHGATATTAGLLYWFENYAK